MGVLRVEDPRLPLRRIPIPKISCRASNARSSGWWTASSRPRASNPDADTSELEARIDRLVYDLYGLTEGEVTAVERSLGVIHATDEEEDEALLKIAEESGPYGPEDFVTDEEVRRTLRAIDGC